ncbi:hypothetical protein BsWGS_04182 [Bradybaena similaris]
MDNFRSTYSVFFNELKDFLDHLLTIYSRDDAPANLQDVKLVLTILPLDDRDFDTMNEDSVFLKTLMVLETMRIVLENVDPYIKKTVKEAFKKEQRNLTWLMGTVELGLTSLTLHEENAPVSILSAGISSTNTGVSRCISNDTRVKLRDVCRTLYRS